MAEVYTVAINNSTPTEILGGRVGFFNLMPQNTYGALYVGGASLSVDYSPGPVVTDGIQPNTTAPGTFDLYVTSPDESTR